MSNIQKNNKPNVPNLRFPEFSGEWKKIRVSDLLEFFSTNSLSWDQLEYGGTDIFNLHYGLIHSGLSTQISLKKSILPSVKSEYRPRNYTLCEDGDVAFADASEDTNEVGKVVEFVDCAGKEIVCGLHTIHGRDKLGKTVVGFKGYAFSSPAFHNQIRRIAQGTKIFSINTGNFEEIFIGVPQKEEQDKISHLLSLLDQRIAIQNRLIEKYESLIKGIVDITILGKEKNANIGDICSISKQIKVEANLNDIISVRLHGKGVCKSCAENLQIGSTQYYRRRTGQLIYGKQNFHNGAIGIVPESLDNGITSKDIPSFDIDRLKCNSLYLLAQLQSPQYYRQAEALTTGTGSKRLKEETFLKMPIVLPDKEEQDNIASLVSCVMTKLDLARRLLALFSCQKNYLLDQLFV